VHCGNRLICIGQLVGWFAMKGIVIAIVCAIASMVLYWELCKGVQHSVRSQVYKQIIELQTD
jgi:hypothetical protein